MFRRTHQGSNATDQTIGVVSSSAERIRSVISGSRASLSRLHSRVTNSSLCASCSDTVSKLCINASAIVRSYPDDCVRQAICERALDPFLFTCRFLDDHRNLGCVLTRGSCIAAHSTVIPICGILTCCGLPLPDPCPGEYPEALEQGRRMVVGQWYLDMLEREHKYEGQRQQMEYRMQESDVETDLGA